MASEPSGQHHTPKRPSKMASSQSLNHLLNFTLPPRQTHSQSLPRRGKKSTAHGVWNKERFVNAQYRFVMNPTGDYTVHFADPDIFFQWQDVLQVVVPRESAYATTSNSEAFGPGESLTTCPICLSPPVVPRMTKCGHVFCFPCILHYLSLSDDLKWARCPICFDSVNAKQLKSVKWFEGSTLAAEGFDNHHSGSSSSCSLHGLLQTAPRTGTFMPVRLMQRPQITTLALPRSQTWPSDLLPPHQTPFHFLPDVYTFAKFMLATPQYLIADLSKDLDMLNVERRSMMAANDELSIVYIDAAVVKLRHQVAKAAALESPQLTRTIDRARKDCEDLWRRYAHDNTRSERVDVEPTDLDEAPDAFLATQDLSSFTNDQPLGSSLPVNSDLATQPIRTSQSTSNRNHRRRNLNPPPPSTQTYYYYQAASGLPIFLHPLDIKILFSHYNGYASFPDEITVRIESAAEGTVNDDLRKRCKYLAHMPEGADVVFIEADLVGVVGLEGLKNFEGALKLRTARRKEKEKKDDRARARAEEKEKERVKLLSREESAVPNYTDSPPPALETEEPSLRVPTSQPMSGAWGPRSFASALHSTPSVSRPQPINRNATPDIGEEWDLDAAWHELEQRSGSRRRGKKLVVLGGGAGGRRR
ncbi:hypothetical protein L210DRAFT_3501601 [Boletus edulis BED1]|uniref:RING-type domain-containing protein n=1 Tax=Boletus edulis BED1 TaxID=1328754 RepID=A0AAD4C1D7_BOLED|nr:hypothetical protein L210DRAFT_3501601 [Boletus edulis BED1]